MTILTEEIPFTTEALKMYVEGVEKRMDELRVYVNEYNRLKTRLKKCNDRMKHR